MKASLLFGLTLALLAAPALAPAQTYPIYPVIHEEPITVNLRDGAGGQPLAHLHVRLVAGYDSADLKKQLWREDLLSDAEGNVRLPRGLVNFPWLQVWVENAPLCEANPSRESFSVERIRTEGMSTANRCGIAIATERPGVLTAFVKTKHRGRETSGPALAVPVAAKVDPPATASSEGAAKTSTGTN